MLSLSVEVAIGPLTLTLATHEREREEPVLRTIVYEDDFETADALADALIAEYGIGCSQ